MSIIAIIPARSGSQRIHNKNIVACGGLPLIAHTCKAATGAKNLSKVIISTDSPEIAAIARHYGVDTPFLRPAHLAANDTPMLPVIQDALATLSAQGMTFTAVALLQPTSPLRTSRHIDEALKLFVDHKPDSIVSVVTVPHIYHPLKLVRPTESGLVPYRDGLPPAIGHRDLPPVYAKNGPAVLVSSIETIRNGSLYGNRSLPYLMSPEDSIDIDEPFDLALAEFLLMKRGTSA